MYKIDYFSLFFSWPSELHFMFFMVDAGGFEPPATWLQTRCSSKLS